MSEIEEIIKKIEKQKIKFYSEYFEKPQHVKMPLWCFEELKKQFAQNSNLFINYYTGDIMFKGLRICPTIAIQRIEEIEVF